MMCCVLKIYICIPIHRPRIVVMITDDRATATVIFTHSNWVMWLVWHLLSRIVDLRELTKLVVVSYVGPHCLQYNCMGSKQTASWEILEEGEPSRAYIDRSIHEYGVLLGIDGIDGIDTFTPQPIIRACCYVSRWDTHVSVRLYRSSLRMLGTALLLLYQALQTATPSLEVDNVVSHKLACSC